MLIVIPYFHKECRGQLWQEDLIAETEALEDKGHKRLIMVYGNTPKYFPEFAVEIQ